MQLDSGRIAPPSTVPGPDATPGGLPGQPSWGPSSNYSVILSPFLRMGSKKEPGRTQRRLCLVVPRAAGQ